MRRLLYHPESDSFVEVHSQEEYEDLLKTADGALCIDVTEEEKAEKLFKEQQCEYQKDTSQD